METMLQRDIVWMLCMYCVTMSSTLVSPTQPAQHLLHRTCFWNCSISEDIRSPKILRIWVQLAFKRFNGKPFCVNCSKHHEWRLPVRLLIHFTAK